MIEEVLAEVEGWIRAISTARHGFGAKLNFHCCLGPMGLFNFDEKGAFYMLILLTNKKR
jgi:hypothetical protein